MNSPNKGTPSWKTGKWPALLENIKQERWIHAESCLSWQHVIQFLTEELKLATVSNREMFYISVSSRKAAATEHCGSIQQASLHKVLENPDNENNGKNPRPGWKARLQPNLLFLPNLLPKQSTVGVRSGLYRQQEQELWGYLGSVIWSFSNLI